MLSVRQTSVPAPFVVAATDNWDGNDGSWSSFALSVGTPAQSFRILPATIGEEVWIPSTDGCAGILAGISDCGDLRGINKFQNAPSRGFMYNESTTWNQLNIYELAEQNLFPSENALYGLDAVSLARTTENNFDTRIQGQTVAAMSTADFWLGSVGLGTSPGQFAEHASSIPSLLVSMKAQNITPSLSYAYTAGQSYASPKTAGSLILGGYDITKLSSSAISFPINPKLSSQALQIILESIVVTHALAGNSQRLLSNATAMNVDSAVSQLWLPASVCQSFADAFGLTYDSDTGLYLVNSTIHSQLKANNPSVTFTIGGSAGGGTTNIVMSYNAFDMEVGIPFYNSSTQYFPIRQAANESQYVLGRTFLQEAYIVVDWERSNFTIGQTIATPSGQNILAILPPNTGAAPTSSTTPPAHTETATTPVPKAGISTGAIAGIVTVMIALVGIGLGVFFYVRRHRRRQTGRALPTELEANSLAVVEHYPMEKSLTEQYPEKHGQVQVTEVPIYELHSDAAPLRELASTPIHEMDQIVFERELMGTPIMELLGSDVGSELDVTPYESRPQSTERVSYMGMEPSRLMAFDERDETPPLEPRTAALQQLEGLDIDQPGHTQKNSESDVGEVLASQTAEQSQTATEQPVHLSKDGETEVEGLSQVEPAEQPLKAVEHSSQTDSSAETKKRGRVEDESTAETSPEASAVPSDLL